jgi:hypothetical protein
MPSVALRAYGDDLVAHVWTLAHDPWLRRVNNNPSLRPAEPGTWAHYAPISKISTR